ncbi:hypothetical protein JL720_2792 [Aureococcus anophagefferens]|nr:hypothetical protein JL720_2792 [Aureococcus anophagefferens]
MSRTSCIFEGVTGSFGRAREPSRHALSNMEGRSRDEQWLLDVVTRCGISAARASDVALQGAQMLRRLNIKVPVGLFKKGECCRRAVALELASREAGGASLRRDALVTACSASSRQYEAVLRHAENALGLVGPAERPATVEALARGLFGEKQNTAALAADARRFLSLLAPPHDAAALAAAAARGALALAPTTTWRLAVAGCDAAAHEDAAAALEAARAAPAAGPADPPSPREPGAIAAALAGAGTLRWRAVLARAARDEDAALRAETDDEEAPEAPAPAAVEEEVLDYAEVARAALAAEAARTGGPPPPPLVPIADVEAFYRISPADIRALEAFEAATAPPSRRRRRRSGPAKKREDAAPKPKKKAAKKAAVEEEPLPPVSSDDDAAAPPAPQKRQRRSSRRDAGDAAGGGRRPAVEPPAQDKARVAFTCTDDDPVKTSVAIAFARGVPIVTSDWLAHCASHGYEEPSAEFAEGGLRGATA